MGRVYLLTASPHQDVNPSLVHRSVPSSQDGGTEKGLGQYLLN